MPEIIKSNIDISENRSQTVHRASLDKTKELANALPYDEAEVFVKEIFKNYPTLVFDILRIEYLKQKDVLTKLNSIVGGADE